MKPRQIDLHVEELILEGFPVADRQVIGIAFRAELTRLLTDQGLPTDKAVSRQVAALSARPITITAGARPEAVGIQTARAVYQGLQADNQRGTPHWKS